MSVPEWLDPRTELRRLLPFATIVLAVAPLAAQEEEAPPTPEEITAMAAAAENAPLFASLDPLVVTLHADMKDLKKERSDEIERRGSFTFPGPDGEAMTVSVKITPRGIFRRNKKNCDFPPIWLDFPKSKIQGTVLDGQNRIKFASPCKDSRDDYQRYIFLEYLVYRTYALITPVSLRVRLLNVTFEDIMGENEDRTEYAFLIEDVDRLAERHFGEESEWERFHPYRTEARQAAIVELFEYMIGNTDWSSYEFHNIKMILQEGPTFLLLPHDFDFAGAVDARYAVPDGTLPIRNVRTRIYRGFCRPDFDPASVFALFNERKDAIYEMVRGFDLLEEKQRDRLLDYYDDFYEVINDEGKAKRRIIEECRPVR